MCDREPLVTLLYVGLWSGCYIPHGFVRLPLSESGFESPSRLVCVYMFVCFILCLFVRFGDCVFYHGVPQRGSQIPVTFDGRPC